MAFMLCEAHNVQAGTKYRVWATSPVPAGAKVAIMWTDEHGRESPMIVADDLIEAVAPDGAIGIAIGYATSSIESAFVVEVVGGNTDSNGGRHAQPA